MEVYVIANVRPTDPGYEAYKEPAAASVASHGGRYLARGGRLEVLEGDWRPTRLVILEFDSYDRAKEWWESQEYAPLKKLRQDTAVSELVLVEGVRPPP